MTLLLPWRRKFLADDAFARAYVKAMAGWEPGAMMGLQLRKLQVVWAECTVNVPYYRNLVRAGQAPARIETWADFHSIPELNRSILQERSGEFRREGAPDLFRVTGGSTGTPVRFGTWKTEDLILRRLKLALWTRAGYHPQARIFLIWGHAHLLGTGWRRWLNHAKRKVKDHLVGYLRMDAHTLSPEYCRTLARRLIAFRPTGLIGYAAALDHFVRMTGEFHSEFRQLGLGFVQPSAEPLPRPDTLALLRDVFAAPVVQEFSGVDFGQVGMKMNDEPFDNFSDYYLVEALSDSATTPGDGTACLTALYPRYTPIIRYQQGDLLRQVTRWENGHVPRFQELGGRVLDMVHLPDGESVHGASFLHCFYHERAILGAQLVVGDADLVLRVVTTEELSPAQEKAIRDRLTQVTPSLAHLRIQRVTDVQTTIAGKRRWFVDKRTRPKAA